MSDWEWGSDIKVVQEDIERLNNPAFADLAVLLVPNIMQGISWNIIPEQVARTPDAVSVFKGIMSDPALKKVAAVNRVGAPGYSDHYKGILTYVKSMGPFFKMYCEAGGSPDVVDLIEGHYGRAQSWREYKKEQFIKLVHSGYEGLISLFSLDMSDSLFIGDSTIPSFPLTHRLGGVKFFITAPEKNPEPLTSTYDDTVENSRLDETSGSVIFRLHQGL